MKDIHGLERSLNESLNWNKARLNCFLKMLLALFAVKTVNLKEIALALNGEVKMESNYRRLQRFFGQFKLDLTQIARWIFKLSIQADEKFYLVMDRTNWYWGKKKINVFVLGIAYEGMAIPIFWTLLAKAGNSNFEEQRVLLRRFIRTFGKDRIHGLLGDREFASGRLFGWLNKQGIPFYIRIKEGSQVCIKKKKLFKAKKIFSQLSPKRKKEYPMAVWIFGQKVFLAGSRSERGELMIVATNQAPKTAIAIYLRRWEIESLFQGLKGRGFRFEETHMTLLERIEKLMALLAIGFIWAHKVGEWRARVKPIIWKQFRNQKRPQSSYFRYGLDLIREAIFHTYSKFSNLKKYLTFLFPHTQPGLSL